MSRQYRSAVRICRENGWKVGDVLESDAEHGTQRIRITALGQSEILARLIERYGERVLGASENCWNLHDRDWRLADPPKQGRRPKEEAR